LCKHGALSNGRNRIVAVPARLYAEKNSEWLAIKPASIVLQKNVESGLHSRVFYLREETDFFLMPGVRTAELMMKDRETSGSIHHQFHCCSALKARLLIQVNATEPDMNVNPQAAWSVVSFSTIGHPVSGDPFFPF
jgi:hypothetical protein